MKCSLLCSALLCVAVTPAVKGDNCLTLGDSIGCCANHPGFQESFFCGWIGALELCEPDIEDDGFFNDLVPDSSGWNSVTMPLGETAPCHYYAAFCDWESSFPPKCNWSETLTYLWCIDYDQPSEPEDCP